MSTKRGRTAAARSLEDRAWIRLLAAAAIVVASLAVGALHTPAGSVAAGETTSTAGGSDASGSVTPTCAVPATPVPLACKVRGLKRGAYTGIFRPPAPYKPQALTTYDSTAGKYPSMVMWFQPWAGASQFDTAAAVALWKRNAVPIVVWEPWNPGDKPHNLKHPADMPQWRLCKIADGDYDPYIRSYADQIKAAGGPVMISLFHEMNGTWYPWCGQANGNNAKQFVRAWHHVHDVFAQEGATNVTWIWSVNFESRPPGKSNRYSAYYPGSKYVDWVGVSGFNWGKGVGGGPWKSFEKIYSAPLKYLRTTHKPIMVTEFASVEQGGNKAAWITNAFKRVRTGHPEIKAVIYYDAKEKSHGHVQDWRFSSSKRSTKAYRGALRSSYFAGTYKPCASWWSALSTEQQSRLTAITRLY